MPDEIKIPKTPKVKTPGGAKTQAATAAPVETAGTQVAAEAPPLFRQQFRQRFQGMNVANPGGVRTPLPVPLPVIERDFGPWAESLKQLMQERFANTPPEERGSYFQQGFEQYPEAMAQMVVRAALNNRLQAQGDVAKWMEIVNERLRKNG